MGKVRSYPTELTDANWQKKKSATAGKTGVGEELKQLAKAYEGVKWSLFEEVEKVVHKSQYDVKFPPAKAELEKVEKFANLCFEFRDFAAKQATTMKALTNKGTKKLLEDMSKSAHDFGDELLSSCKGSLENVTNSKVIAEYPKRLQAWIERKNNLLKVFKKAKTDFDVYLKNARTLAQQSDDLAKNMPTEQEAVKRVLKSLAENAVSVNEIHKTMKSEFAEYFKLFEPHRSAAEKADAQQLDQKDLDGQIGIFTEADNLRKELEELQKAVEAVFQETIDSAKEAQAAALTGGAKAAAHLKIANDLVKTYGSIGEKINTAFIAKSIFDRSEAYRDAWMKFFSGVDDKEMDKEKRAELIRLGKVRAQQRRDQVDELEGQLKRIYEAAKLAIEKVVQGIPEQARLGEIAGKLELVHKSLKQGQEFVDKWVEENAAAHKTFDETMIAVDKLL